MSEAIMPKLPKTRDLEGELPGGMGAKLTQAVFKMLFFCRFERFGGEIFAGEGGENRSVDHRFL